eukprot:PhM_4_TR234/c0_g1_i1/m.81377
MSRASLSCWSAGFASSSATVLACPSMNFLPRETSSSRRTSACSSRLISVSCVVRSRVETSPELSPRRSTLSLPRCIDRRSRFLFCSILSSSSRALRVSWYSFSFDGFSSRRRSSSFSLRSTRSCFMRLSCVKVDSRRGPGEPGGGGGAAGFFAPDGSFGFAAVDLALRISASTFLAAFAWRDSSAFAAVSLRMSVEVGLLERSGASHIWSTGGWSRSVYVAMMWKCASGSIAPQSTDVLEPSCLSTPLSRSMTNFTAAFGSFADDAKRFGDAIGFAMSLEGTMPESAAPVTVHDSRTRPVGNGVRLRRTYPCSPSSVCW